MFDGEPRFIDGALALGVVASVRTVWDPTEGAVWMRADFGDSTGVDYVEVAADNVEQALGWLDRDVRIALEGRRGVLSAELGVLGTVLT